MACPGPRLNTAKEKVEGGGGDTRYSFCSVIKEKVWKTHYVEGYLSLPSLELAKDRSLYLLHVWV